MLMAVRSRIVRGGSMSGTPGRRIWNSTPKNGMNSSRPEEEDQGGTAMLAEPGHYDYAPYTGRPRIVWPGGARIAVWLAPNIEHYELEPPDNARKTPWPRPVPDVLNYSHRDYGNRVGFWRMADVMARHGVRGSVSVNVAVFDT